MPIVYDINHTLCDWKSTTLYLGYTIDSYKRGPETAGIGILVGTIL